MAKWDDTIDDVDGGLVVAHLNFDLKVGCVQEWRRKKGLRSAGAPYERPD